MGEKESESFQFTFNGFLKVAFQGSRVTSDAGLVLVRELDERLGFIVTNLRLPHRAVVRFYNKRGTAEQWIKEGKQAAHWTRLSCHRFRANEVRLQLSVLAYTLRQPLAPTGAPDADRHVVADQPPAAPRQDGWAARETCPLLLAPAGREPPDPPRIWALPVPSG